MIQGSGTELINAQAMLDRIGIRERAHIADLGCGALGHFVFPAAMMVGPKGKVYGVDILRNVLEILAKRAHDLNATQVVSRWGDIDVYRGTGIANGELDLTLLVNNLFLSKNRQMLAKEMARITKPGGRVLIIDWKMQPTPLGPPIKSRVPLDQAIAAMQLPEFSLLESFDAGPFHYGLIFGRTDKPHKA
jgi:ubiquinone/menaquinone biosynthesis C-methylase UbiE